MVGGGRRGIQAADPRAVRPRGRSLFRHGAALGRRHHRAGRDAAGVVAGAVGDAECADPGDEVRGIQDVAFAEHYLAQRDGAPFRRILHSLGLRNVIGISASYDIELQIREERYG